MKTYQLEFGAFARPFSEQLPELAHDVAAIFDGHNLAVSRLAIHRLITDDERTRIHRRLAANIGEAVALKRPIA